VTASGRAHSRSRIIAVTSGKGGVGKTNVAVNLAICLATRGYRTLLIDVDLGLANADILLNANPRCTLAHVISGARRFEDITVEAPGGIYFVSGGSGVAGLINLSDPERERLLMQVRSARVPINARPGAASRLRPGGAAAIPPDIIILDCAAGISSAVTAFALAAEDVLLVTTPEPTAITDAYAAVKTLVRAMHRGTVRLVVNMADSRDEARQVFERIAAVSDKFLKFSIADGGYIVQDTHIELAVRSRTPFVLRYPRSPASVCMAAVAARLARSKAHPAGRQGLLRRIAGMFL
jgi:flagellar biosynthesis protein FlhG